MKVLLHNPRRELDVTGPVAVHAPCTSCGAATPGEVCALCKLGAGASAASPS